MNIRLYVILFFYFLVPALGRAQTPQIDSLRNAVRTAKDDTLKVSTLIILGDILWKSGYNDSALKYAEVNIVLSQKLGYNKGLGKGYSIRGIAFYALGKYPEALKNHFAALKIRERSGDQQGIAASYTNIGNVYYLQGNFSEALKKYTQAFTIMKKIGNTQGVAASYNNLGLIYIAQKNYTEALANYSASLKIREENGDMPGKAICYNNIGGLYGEMGNLQECLKNHFEALKIRQEIGDKGGEASSLGNIGIAYYRLKNYVESEKYILKGMNVSRRIGDLEGLKDGYVTLSGINSDLGNHKKALDHYRSYIALKDSLLNEENTKRSVRLEMNYEFDKKEAAAKLEQEKKEAVAAADARRQRIILLAISGLGILILGFALFAYRSFLQKKKANIEISRQKHLIEEKQKEILDSIYYARRIQRSLLTNERYIQRKLVELKK